MRIRIVIFNIFLILICFSCNKENKTNINNTENPVIVNQTGIDEILEDNIVVGEEYFTFKWNDKRGRESTSMIKFDEDGIVNYFNYYYYESVSGADKEYRTNHVWIVNKKESEYYVYDESGNTPNDFSIKIDDDKVLIMVPNRNYIMGECLIKENSIIFEWSKKYRDEEGFTYTFEDNSNNFQAKKFMHYEYLFSGNRYASYLEPDIEDDGDKYNYEIIKKNNSEYDILMHNPRGDAIMMTVEANVSRKTMIQNAINLCITLQDFKSADCIPFLFGRY